MNENVVDQHFHLLRNARNGFSRFSLATNDPKAFTASESTKSMDSSDYIPD